MNRKAPASSFVLILEAGKTTNTNKSMNDQVRLEERIAPSVNGAGGYDGQPGNQNSAKHNPSGSANPENKPGN